MLKAKATTAARRCDTSHAHPTGTEATSDSQRSQRGAPLIVHDAIATKSTMLSCTAAGWATRLSSVARSAAGMTESACSARTECTTSESSTTPPSHA